MTKASEWHPRGATKKIGSDDYRRLLTKVAKEQTALPRLVGDGQPCFSTSLAVDRFPRCVWDTNCFYRSLKVSSGASRAELAVAFMKGEGHSSARLTHILKTLIDRESRRRYDATPLGCFWADDPLLWHRLVDEDEADGLSVVQRVVEPWAVYALGVDTIDYSLADAWRSAVASAWWDAGLVEDMAVGLCHDLLDAHVRQVGTRKVAFLPKGIAAKDARVYAHVLAQGHLGKG